MFTGIIETVGFVQSISENGTNKSFWIASAIAGELQMDQSVSHQGVCLTVDQLKADAYRVTAIEETLKKTNLGKWQTGDKINLERCLPFNGRIDGHIVQGHVDTTAFCTARVQKEGSVEFTFRFPASFAALIIEKGSVSVNGTSLTVFNITNDHFTVAIIPYTLEHTSISEVFPETIVNIEFDILGKYIHRLASLKEL